MQVKRIPESNKLPARSCARGSVWERLLFLLLRIKETRLLCEIARGATCIQPAFYTQGLWSERRAVNGGADCGHTVSAAGWKTLLTNRCSACVHVGAKMYRMENWALKLGIPMTSEVCWIKAGISGFGIVQFPLIKWKCNHFVNHKNRKADSAASKSTRIEKNGGVQPHMETFRGLRTCSSVANSKIRGEIILYIC